MTAPKLIKGYTQLEVGQMVESAYESVMDDALEVAIDRVVANLRVDPDQILAAYKVYDESLYEEKT